jgi:hypothetical protein
MDIYTLVQGDTAPQIKATITREDSGSVVSFAGGSVRMRFRAKGSTTTLFTLNAVDVSTNFADGIAIFNFASGNLDIDAGYYQGEIEITYASGEKETIFEILNFNLRADFND